MAAYPEPGAPWCEPLFTPEKWQKSSIGWEKEILWECPGIPSINMGSGPDEEIAAVKEPELTTQTFRKCHPWGPRLVMIGAFGALLTATAETARAETKVTLQKVPNGGLQPQAVMDTKGTLHLIYIKGEPGAGDLFYVRRAAGKERFSVPLRVNSLRGSAIAVGSVRGGQIALGKKGRVHVAWNGSGKVKKAGGMFYARLNDAGTAFEKQRDLMAGTAILDGGGTVAADRSGNVYVAWQALKAGGKRGEQNRRMWVARSTDEGKTFSKAAPPWEKPTGACGCCSTRAFADRRGTVYLAYRSATAQVHRDLYLLCSRDRGKSFQEVLAHRWKVPG
jgi:hypothetical protein